ncbi:MAG TPA: alpha/beta hydrolase [Thermoleophilaceae bacterium]
MTTVSAGDATLKVFDQGTGPPVLLIHGVGSTGELWASDVEPLTDRFRIVTYNRRGYAGSAESPRDWSAHGADAAGLVEALDLGPCAVVGYSGGAIAALWLALNRPELVERVVLVDPVVHVTKSVTPRFAATFARYRLVRRLRGARAALPIWFGYVTSRSDGSGSVWADPKVPQARRDLLLGAAEGVAADFDSGDGGPEVPAEALAGIDKPVFVVEASLSVAFIRKAIGRLTRLMPQARVLSVEGAGHILAYDRPDEFRAALVEALTT